MYWKNTHHALLTAHHHQPMTIFQFPICSLHFEQTKKARVEEWKMSGERWNLTIHLKFLQTSVDAFYRKCLISYLGISV